ncbi:DUF4158 domain-containing protein [Streptomyces sp. SP17KL33]|nr:DUF4158 domain-containing protein [Streptomyces sp. SP17KL33]MEE1832355.1 DUF4158 domain-containing protein [Streptomyces sp. SP17KL33]
MRQAARYGSTSGAPSRTELERYRFLDDSDVQKVQAKRRSHNRLAFAAQLTSVRHLGRFTPDPCCRPGGRRRSGEEITGHDLKVTGIIGEPRAYRMAWAMRYAPTFRRPPFATGQRRGRPLPCRNSRAIQ